MDSLEQDEHWVKFVLPSIFVITLIISIGLSEFVEYLFPNLNTTYFIVAIPTILCSYLGYKRYKESKARNHAVVDYSIKDKEVRSYKTVIKYIIHGIFTFVILNIFFSVVSEMIIYQDIVNNIDHSRDIFFRVGEYFNVYYGSFFISLALSMHFFRSAFQAYKIIKSRNNII